MGKWATKLMMYKAHKIFQNCVIPISMILEIYSYYFFGVGKYWQLYTSFQTHEIKGVKYGRAESEDNVSFLLWAPISVRFSKQNSWLESKTIYC